MRVVRRVFHDEIKWRYYQNWRFNWTAGELWKLNIISPFFRFVRHNMAYEIGFGNHYVVIDRRIGLERTLKSEA